MDINNLKLVRIDFRLIHGQVMTRWVVKHNIKNIIVIDNNSASNPLLKKILVKSAPSGIDVHVYTIEEASQRWDEKSMPNENVLILFKNTSDALEAWRKGIHYPTIQIGSIEGGGNKKNIYKNIVMTPSEIDEMKYLHEQGVQVYLQPIPEDRALNLLDAI